MGMDEFFYNPFAHLRELPDGVVVAFGSDSHRDPLLQNWCAVHFAGDGSRLAKAYAEDYPSAYMAVTEPFVDEFEGEPS